MKIVLFTTNSMPGIVAFREFVEKHPDKIAAILIFPPIPKTLTKKRAKFADFLKNIPFSLLFYKLLENSVYYHLRILLRKDTIVSLGKKFGITVRKYGNPNDEEVRTFLRELGTEIIINCAPAIIKKETIDIPEKGCFNFHAALLPDYRGVANYFWFLINKAKEAGGTLHYLVPGIDEGEVVTEERFEIREGDTVHSINYRTNAVCPVLLDRLIDMIDKNEIASIPQDESKICYRSFPTRKNIKRFRKNGGKLFTFKDFYRSLKH